MALLRLLIDPPLDGPANMARDEALLDAVGYGETPPTLRLYRWSPATVSLGYFQTHDEFRTQPPPIRDLAVVRRTTGGGAILHDIELTYSLAVPIDCPWLAPNANRLYELAHRAIIAAVGPDATFHQCASGPTACGESDRTGEAGGARASSASARRGPFFCFARRHSLDVVAPAAAPPDARRKLAGSAQRRTRKAVLQHGSLLLASRYPDQPCVTWSELGGPSDFDAAARRLITHFAAALDTSLEADEWKAGELLRAVDARKKYAGRGWTEGVAPGVEAENTNKP